jgi:hypothetical protein
MAGDDTGNDGRNSPVRGTHAASAGGATAAEVLASAVPGVDVAPSLGLDDMLPLAIPSHGRRGAGRPVGAVNVRTNKTFQAAISRCGDPLIASIAWGNMDTRDLIVEMRKIASDCGIKLGATVMDVVRFQEQCRAAALPYGHAKRAAVNEAGHDVTPVIVMGGAPGSTTNVQVNAGAAPSLEDMIEAERSAQQDQLVSDDDVNVSHGEKSHDEG